MNRDSQQPQSDNRLRVLWVAKGLGPGGAERLLCAHAAVHDTAVFDIECAYVLAWKDHLAEELEQAGVRTRCLSERRSDPMWPIRLTRLIRSGRWDVVHVHSPLPGSIARLAARSLPAGRRPAIISTEHNAWATHRTPTRLLNRWTGRWNTRTIAVTDEVRRSLRGRAVGTAEVLQHGIDVRSIAGHIAERSAVRRELALAADDVIIGTVANFRPQKDYPNLLAAFRLLLDREVEARLLVVGQGPDEASIRRRCTELNLDGHVIFAGFRPDAARLMAACDVFVLASQWEGLPVAVMEALALGLPIVATKVGGVAESLTDGVDGVLVPPSDPAALADGLMRVAVDAQLRTLLATGSAQRAGEFDVSASVRHIEQAYRAGHTTAVTPTAAASSSKTLTARPNKLAGVDMRLARPEDRQSIIDVCRASLGWPDDRRFDQLFAWKHDENVFGPSQIWVAVHSDRVVGVRAFMRWEFLRGGTVVRAVRAVDTAVHPDHHGKGLFTALTTHGLEALHSDGVDFVFNTPNSASRPGYEKMGWQVVGKLPVAVRPNGIRGALTAARSRSAAGHWPVSVDFGIPVDEVADQVAAQQVANDVRALQTNAHADFWRWRYGSPLLGYRALPHEDGHVVVRLRPRGRARELVVLGSTGLSKRAVNEVVDAALSATAATHALRLGEPSIRQGWLPVPGLGPVLTWRDVSARAKPPASNWHLNMGDIELF